MSPASNARICKSIASLLDEPYRQEASRLGPMIDALKRALAAYDVDGVARVLKEISEVVLQVKDDRAGSAEMMACMIGVENGDYWAVLAQEGWEVAGASGDGREGLAFPVPFPQTSHIRPPQWPAAVPTASVPWNKSIATARKSKFAINPSPMRRTPDLHTLTSVLNNALELLALVSPNFVPLYHAFQESAQARMVNLNSVLMDALWVARGEEPEQALIEIGATFRRRSGGDGGRVGVRKSDASVPLASGYSALLEATGLTAGSDAIDVYLQQEEQQHVPITFPSYQAIEQPPQQSSAPVDQLWTRQQQQEQQIPIMFPFCQAIEQQPQQTSAPVDQLWTQQQQERQQIFPLIGPPDILYGSFEQQHAFDGCATVGQAPQTMHPFPQNGTDNLHVNKQAPQPQHQIFSPTNHELVEAVCWDNIQV
ncbi:hypothetical protein Tdes44962_MAKER09024 [Teratosphaeria destructans]|uniref:Uncharacterized protein n=1 Tax=Teratosphaeria destructans TaxID=418781 RepID=A0A9W7W3H7_9PEZI|nr:hypothetical protein Tdes44962_MAKER09024 [Teratosphaeria destructans]